MVYPMMVGVDLGSLRDVARQPQGLLITFVVNWLIKPFTMAAMAVVFFRYVFAQARQGRADLAQPLGHTSSGRRRDLPVC
jgi:ACR3 family arsenite efflux pump ArsB